MSQITRPNKASSGGSPSYVPGADILADEANADFDTIYNDYKNNVDDSNIKSGAAIQGSKLADSPNGIPTTKLNALVVTKAKVANDTLTSAQIDDTETTNAGTIALAVSANVFYDTGIAHATRQAVAIYCNDANVDKLTKFFLVKGGGGNWLILMQQTAVGGGVTIAANTVFLYHIAKS